MDAGTLDKRISFIDTQDVKTKYGTTSKQKAVHLTCWARIEPMRGREYIEAAKSGTEDVWKITTRYHKWLRDDMTIRYRGTEFEIKSIVDPYENHSSLEIYCQRRTSGRGAAI